MSEPCFTLEDVAKHNGHETARTWIIIKDLVYDVTDYLNEHPGGGELLLEYAGKDGTAAFEDFGHSADAKNILKLYRIGRLAKKGRGANGIIMVNDGKRNSTNLNVKKNETRKIRSIDSLDPYKTELDNEHSVGVNI